MCHADTYDSVAGDGAAGGGAKVVAIIFVIVAVDMLTKDKQSLTL